MLCNRGKKGVYAFVCFGTEKDDPDARHANAINAIEGLNGKELVVDRALFVGEAKNAKTRQRELQKQTLVFKRAMKRCNLYVRKM